MADLQKKVDELQKKSEEGGEGALQPRSAAGACRPPCNRWRLKERVEQRRLDTTVERLTRDRNRELVTH